MRSGSFRFRPPGMALDPTLRWVVVRAFGDPSLAMSCRPDPARVVDTVRSLDLGARIVARIAEPVLEAEAGHSGLIGLNVDAAVADARAEQVLEAVTAVEGVVNELGCPVVLLKYAALEAAGFVPRGSRSVSDLDVLVDRERSEQIVAGLGMAGYASELMMAVDHHLPVLHREGGAAIEIHMVMPGVRVRGRTSAGVDDLVSCGLVGPVPSRGAQLLMPARDILIAHALVHGIAQHGLHPASYPMMRMVADLVDLGFARLDGAAVAATVMPWIDRDVSPAEVEAVRRLCVALVGADPTLAERPGDTRPEAVLLRHIVAGICDQDYRESLVLRAAFSAPARGGRVGGWAFAFRQAVFISRAQVDAIYGRPRTELGYLARRVLRPLDLAWRAGRSFASWLVVRSGRKRPGRGPQNTNASS